MEREEWEKKKKNIKNKWMKKKQEIEKESKNLEALEESDDAPQSEIAKSREKNKTSSNRERLIEVGIYFCRSQKFRCSPERD